MALIKNGTLEKGSVLFWDEPEANINPKYIPVLAELLIMLEREGVQIFVATHDYFLAKYIEVKRREDSDIQYISLYKMERYSVRQQERLNYWSTIPLWIHFDSFTEKKSGWY